MSGWAEVYARLPFNALLFKALATHLRRLLMKAVALKVVLKVLFPRHPQLFGVRGAVAVIVLLLFLVFRKPVFVYRAKASKRWA